VTTSYRDIFLLACCQALLLVNGAGLISMNGLIGYELATDKSFATLGATTYVLGSALAAMPAALWMGRAGRRAGFMTGALINVGGCLLAAWALALASFPLFCVATGVIGIYNAIGLQYRFAAAEVAAPADRAKAISLVLAGGIVGGVVGPESTRWAKDLFATPFLGSFVALAVQSRVRVPPPPPASAAGSGRPLAVIVRQPVFVVAALAAGLGYGVMNLLMVATPLAMSFCSHPYASAAMVIEWHVIGMYGPGFFTGSLIRRFGVLQVIGAGTALVAGCVAVALSGTTLLHFTAALVLLGVGWNFMYTGGTTLLTESARPDEKAKTQGANDVFMLATMGISSFSSGALLNAAGWERMNLGVLPVLLIVAAAAAGLAMLRRRPGRAAA
jgi:MFS family permease